MHVRIFTTKKQQELETFVVNEAYYFWNWSRFVVYWNHFGGGESWYWWKNFMGNWRTFLGAEEFFGSLRNCEWLTLFCCAREFYRGTHNLLGSEGFLGMLKQFFEHWGSLFKAEFLGWLKGFLVLNKFIYSNEGLWVTWKFFLLDWKRIFFGTWKVLRWLRNFSWT